MSDSTEYYIKIDDTAFMDSESIYFPGIQDKTTWDFTTGAGADTTSPAVVTYTPPDDDTDVDPYADLVLTFSEPVISNTGSVVIYNASDDSVFETVSVTSAGVTGSGTDTITIDPQANLVSLSSYYIRIDPAAFRDLADNDYAGIADKTTWNFTALDVTPPAVSTLSPPMARQMSFFPLTLPSLHRAYHHRVRQPRHLRRGR